MPSVADPGLPWSPRLPHAWPLLGIDSTSLHRTRCHASELGALLLSYRLPVAQAQRRACAKASFFWRPTAWGLAYRSWHWRSRSFVFGYGCSRQVGSRRCSSRSQEPFSRSLASCWLQIAGCHWSRQFSPGMPVRWPPI